MDPVSVIAGVVTLANNLLLVTRELKENDTQTVELRNRISRVIVVAEQLYTVGSEEGLAQYGAIVEQLHRWVLRTSDLIHEITYADDDRASVSTARKMVRLFKATINRTDIAYRMSCFNNEADKVMADLSALQSSIANNKIDRLTDMLRDQQLQKNAGAKGVGGEHKENKLLAESYVDAPEEGDIEPAVLGEGALGTIHRRRNVTTNEVYAVKVIATARAARRGVTEEALEREAAVLQRLSHPHVARHIISFYSSGDSGGWTFNVVMEYVAGRCSMVDRVVPQTAVEDNEALERQDSCRKPKHRPPLATMLVYAQQLVDALAYLHSSTAGAGGKKAVLHRDLRAENVLLAAPFDTVKIIDFAQCVELRDADKRGEGQWATGTVGDARYASKEKLAGDRPYDGRDDVYAAGCLLAEVLYGERLRVGESIADAASDTAERRRREILDRCCITCPELGAVLRGMLNPVQDERPTAAALHERLKGVQLTPTVPAMADGMQPTASAMHAEYVRYASSIAEEKNASSDAGALLSGSSWNTAQAPSSWEAHSSGGVGAKLDKCSDDKGSKGVGDKLDKCSDDKGSSGSLGNLLNRGYSSQAHAKGEESNAARAIGSSGFVHGKDVITRNYKNGDKYEGEICLDMRHGRGVCHYANGSVYEGEWMDGEKHGVGRMLVGSSGSEYDGQWRNGVIHGTGTYKWTDGRMYVGEWRAGKQSGIGSYSMPDGSKYDGEWAEGQMHGHGVMVYANGDRYEGAWEEGLRHGKGVLVEAATGKRIEGKWKADDLKSKKGWFGLHTSV